MPTTPSETFDDPAEFLRAVKNNGKKPPRKPPRTNSGTTTLSGAHSEPGVGDQHGALMRLSALHYYVRWRAGAGFDCWSPYSDRTTTACADYAAAVRAAEQELRDET